MISAPAFHYIHSGLSIASEVPLPEWDAFASPPVSDPDVAFSLAAPKDIAQDAHGEITQRCEALGFAIARIARWDIAGGRRIMIAPHPGADERAIRLFTLGSAWAALGYQRGFAMWHGSAVARAGKALLLCGPPGEGKSTLAAALVAKGWTLVADDLSRVEPRAQGAFLYPSSASVKLWSETITRLGWEDRVLARDWIREDKFRCAVPQSAAGGPAVPLAGVVVLGSGDTLTMQRLSGAAALAAVLRATLYRPAMLDALGGWEQQGRLAAQIVRSVSTHQLTRPRDLAALGDSVDAVSALIETW